MAIAKVILNGVTQMDVTQKTVTAGSMLSGTTALKNDGTDITGSIASKSSSDLTASGATVTAPAGYYASAASKSVASGSASTPATTITANPTVSVNSSGLITATVSKTQSVTPSVSAGYVSSGTAGDITVSGSGTSQLTTQAAQTIHPSTEDQTIASGKYLTGTQTIKAVTTTNLTAANIVQGVTVKIGDSTDDDCVVSVTGTAETGGGGGPTLLSSQTVELSCTSTSWTLLETLDVGTDVFYDGIVYVKIRDTAGRRAGYFYGSDSYIYNMHYISNLTTVTAAAVSNNIGWYCGTSTTNLTAARNNSQTTEQGYYGLRAIQANTDGELTIWGRYNTTYSRTIDGTYKVDVYLLPYPGGTFA